MTADDASSVDLAAAFTGNRNPLQLISARTDLVDTQVFEAVQQWLRPASGTLVIAAVGGYGRRELFPFSDIDLLILADTEGELTGLAAPLATFLGKLWDRGLRVSHSTRTIADCCRFHPDHVELHISLLDLRYIAGDAALYLKLTNQLSASYARHAPAILRQLTSLARQRHSKYNGTPYHLEPNVKESPGGIRDLHLLRWLAQLQPGQRFLQESFSDVPGHVAKECLFAFRCFLHIRAQRDANLLTFEMQDEAARLLLPTTVSPEECMRVYFTHARRVFQRSLRALEFAELPEASLLRRFREWKSNPSNREFLILRNRIHIRTPSDILLSGEGLLRLFAFVGEQGIQLSWEAQWRLQQGKDAVSAAFRFHPPGWEQWRELFRQPQAALALTEMQETGVLAAAIPLWSSIDSLVVRDFYHRYTVDEHTLVTIRDLDRLAAPVAGRSGRFETLAHEAGDLTELRLALLLHDIGKGTEPGDHVQGSIAAAAIVMAFMDVPEASRQTIEFLIRHHLDLSTIMNGRDLEDPATARFLTSQIPTLESLRLLTLMTYADISAVNPTAMSPWRLEQLWRVYTLGAEQLTRELVSDRIHYDSVAAGASSQLLEFLDGFPKRYVRTHSRQQIDHHLELAKESRRRGVAVEITRESGVYLMTVLTHDKSGLFAALCGVLASFGMNIVKGEASSNSAKIVLDLIRFTDPIDTLALNPEELESLQAKVKEVVNGATSVQDLLKRRRQVRRRTGEPSIAPWVNFDNGASEEATLIHFVGEDRPGLLHDLAAAISAAKCNIEVVMIDTEAHKAIDVFYVTHEGKKLADVLQERLEAALMQVASASANG